MLKFHRNHKHEGTIAVTKVKEPSRFGVILSDENNKIINFIEKPQEWIGDNINSGLYIFNKSFLERVNPVPSSLEREVFPQMAKEGELYVYQMEGFWADIGQPKDFLIGTTLFLNDLAGRNKGELYAKGNSVGNVLVVSLFSELFVCFLFNIFYIYIFLGSYF
jgi:mannose-1-phosphate guanylyltransferase